MLALATRAVEALEQIAVELSKITALIMRDAAEVERLRNVLDKSAAAGRR